MRHEAVRSATSRQYAPPSSAGLALGYHVGEVIAGKYELLRVIGSGGMGAVWAVRNLIIDAEFALKMIRNDGGEAHAAERMLREARSAARVEHPAIVRTFDFGVTERGDPFIVMDLLDGTPLRDLLARGPLAPVEAVKLVLPVAEGLHAAHSRGVMHRDVKTDNIVIVRDGSGRLQPTLVDFGIAKRLGPEAHRLTVDGTVIGSPEYMSPEQACGSADVDHKTDVWSLAVVLHEMITGRTPFQRDGGIATVLRAITDEPMRPLDGHGVDEPELDAILRRALSKLPSGRYPDMFAFGAALARWLLIRGVETDASARSIRALWFGASASAPPVALDAIRPPGGRRRRRQPDIPGLPPRRGWAVAAFVAALAAGAAVGAELYSERSFAAPELGMADEAPLPRAAHAASIPFEPALPEISAVASVSPDAPPPVETEPPPAGGEATSRTPAPRGPSRARSRSSIETIESASSRASDEVRPYIPTPREVDVADLASTRPPALPDDLRAPNYPDPEAIPPYRSDNPY